MLENLEILYFSILYLDRCIIGDLHFFLIITFLESSVEMIAEFMLVGAVYNKRI